jgi:hypothetical protein
MSTGTSSLISFVVMGEEVFEKLVEVYEDVIEQNETVEQFGHRFDAEPSTFVSIPKA